MITKTVGALALPTEYFTNKRHKLQPEHNWRSPTCLRSTPRHTDCKARTTKERHRSRDVRRKWERMCLFHSSSLFGFVDTKTDCHIEVSRDTQTLLLLYVGNQYGIVSVLIRGNPTINSLWEEKNNRIFPKFAIK